MRDEQLSLALEAAQVDDVTTLRQTGRGDILDRAARGLAVGQRLSGAPMVDDRGRVVELAPSEIGGRLLSRSIWRISR